jgi:hypothetical protein
MGRLAEVLATPPVKVRHVCQFGDWLDSLSGEPDESGTSDRDDVWALLTNPAWSSQGAADLIAETFGVKFTGERVRVHRRGGCPTCTKLGRF